MSRMKLFGYLIVLYSGLFHLGACSIFPEQVRLAYGDNPYEMVVTWITESKVDLAIVEYGIGEMDNEANNSDSTLFMNTGSGKLRSQYIHRVKLSQLKPNSEYIYRVGSKLAWTSTFHFKTPPAEGEVWSPQLAIFGDLGVENAVSLPRLETETMDGWYDAIIHVGDFAYDLDTDNGEYADKFFREIEPIAAYVPYMACPGNHEEAYNFSHYRNLFSMPGGTESLWYSFNMGPVHFISISTEVYYYLSYGLKLVAKQYEWLEQDLMEATSTYNRTIRPWIVVYGHRPMYCSTSNTDDCNYHTTQVRVGLPVVGWYGLEDLFYNYGVDLLIWAHEHNYERLWPVYNFQVFNGSEEEPYRNPGAPTHITTGSAGCSENHDHFRAPPAWTAFQSTDYGYTRMKVHNNTHIYMEQISEDKGGEVIDSLWLIRETHGPYGAKKPERK